MKKIINKYVEESKINDIRRNNLRKEAELLAKKQEEVERQLNELEYVNWVGSLVKPLAVELSEKLGKKYDIYGPFGLRAAVSIYLMDDLKVSITKQETYGITLAPGDLKKGELFYETNETKNEFSKGTIGYMNGMNNVVKILPDSIDDIVALLVVTGAHEE